jgi:hypothetical protein
MIKIVLGVLKPFSGNPFSCFSGEIVRKRILFVESKLNVFIYESRVLVCHIHHVTNEASKKSFWKP